MKVLLSILLILLIIGLAACSASQSATPTLPAWTLIQVQTGELIDQTAVAPEPLPKTFQVHKETATTRKFDDAPDLDLFRLAKELVPGGGDIARIVEGGKKLPIGHIETFWLISLAETKTYQSEFTLRLVTDHANWYVENNLGIDSSSLLLSATHFEEDIYPAVTRIFGTEWTPGIDNDPRLNILNARLAGVAGYFNSTDEYPIAVRPRSNQREIIYINALDIQPGSTNYDQVLSHELQHIIHWNADASEDTWVNEGLSELSSSIASGSTFSIGQFLRGPPVSLTNWPTSSDGGINSYGAASLFMHFLTEHYGGRDNLRDLLSQPKDGIAGVDGYLEQLGYDAQFDDVFREWSAANILDNHLNPGDDILGYHDLDVRASVTEIMNGLKTKQLKMPQYAVEYTELRSVSEPFRLSFEGQTNTKLLPVNVKPPGCWWSNSGDSIDSTLSHQVDLPVGSTAVLEYEVWFELEEDWDYVYVEISVDGRENWQIIETPHTSSKNPLGNGFGAGYTGKSGGWLTDSVDLTPFVGEDLWIRFQYVTDDAINAAGACFRNLSAPEVGISDDSDWEPRGFVFTDNVVRQNFQVQLITVGDEPKIRQLPLDSTNSGKWTVQPPRGEERLVIAVGSLAEKTRELASYTLSVTPLK